MICLGLSLGELNTLKNKKSRRAHSADGIRCCKVSDLEKRRADFSTLVDVEPAFGIEPLRHMCLVEHSLFFKGAMRPDAVLFGTTCDVSLAATIGMRPGRLPADIEQAIVRALHRSTEAAIDFHVSLIFAECGSEKISKLVHAFL